MNFNKEVFIKNYRIRYLVRMCSIFFIYLLVTLCYFLFGIKNLTLFDYIMTFIFLVFWNIIITGAGALLIFSGLSSRLKGGGQEQVRNSIRALPLQSMAFIAAISTLYGLFIAFVGARTETEGYRTIIRVMELILNLSYSYVFIPVFYSWITIRSLAMRMKQELFEQTGLQFEPTGKSFQTEILLSFIMISLYPISVVIFSLYSQGFLITILNVTPYLIAYLLIITMGIIFIVAFQSRSFSEPLKRLTRFVEQIRNGNYAARTPVTQDNEIGILAASVNSMAAGLEEREKIKDVFGRMVDPAVRDHVLKGNSDMGGTLTEATILFSDIRGFTTLSEKMAPDRVVRLLNRYFESMSQAISSYDGLVNKYIGDAVMALFGVLTNSPLQADMAVGAAVAMQKNLAQLNTEFVSEGLPVIQSGIGIHKGKVLAGNIGCSARMEYTVIGDVVNAASRIEGLTKHLADGVAISGEVKNALQDPNRYHYRFLARAIVKGKEIPVELFEIIDGLSDPGQEARLASIPDYENAVTLYYKRDFTGAQKIFVMLAEKLPRDKILQYYIRQCGRYAAEGVPHDWEGLENSLK